MPINFAIEYLRAHKKSLSGKIFEGYIAIVAEGGNQVLAKREEPIFMDYGCFYEYLLSYREMMKVQNSIFLRRSLAIFFLYDEGSVPAIF